MPETHLRNLKALAMGNLDVPSLEILIDLGVRRQNPSPLRLEAFIASLDYTDVQLPEVMRLLRTFLQSQSSKLGRLELHIIFGDYDVVPLRAAKPHVTPLQIPMMPALRSFRLERGRYDLQHTQLALPL